MKEVVIATRNRKKLIELKRLLRGSKIRVLTLNNFKNLPDVKEDGETFRANAKKKALEISRRINKLVMADDSGLEVYALGNKPGVNSARYAGPSQDDNKNIAKLLKDMKHLSGRKRQGHFICVICISKGRKVIGIVEGIVRGRITQEPKGKSGFGYDPVFMPEGYNKTFAKLGPKIKDRISHRHKALKKAKKIILRTFQRYSRSSQRSGPVQSCPQEKARADILVLPRCLST
jgi:XTP/dITP diphosphohydrolase